MFLRNLWVDLAEQTSIDPFTIYQEDWSFLDVANFKRLTFEEQTKEYEKMCNEEFDEQFFDRVWDSRMAGSDKSKQYIKKLCRNRMVLGSMRYSKLSERGYMGYDLVASINLRMNLGYSTETLEPFIDSYNMAYLQWLKDNRSKKAVKACESILMTCEYAHSIMNWPLGHVDDGMHATKLQ